MRLVVAKVFWVLVLSVYAEPSPLSTPRLNGCVAGLQYCCRSVYRHRGIVATLWLENGSIFRRIPGNEPFLSSAESSLQCAVELAGSVTKWSTSLILYFEPNITKANQTVEVVQGSDIAEFRCNIELGDLTLRDRIEDFELWIQNSCEGSKSRILSSSPSVPLNRTALFQSESAEVSVEDFSVRLNYTKLSNDLPFCVECVMRLSYGSKIFYTRTKIIQGNNTTALPPKMCSLNEKNRTQSSFQLVFTQGECKEFEKGEVIQYYMKTNVCLEKAEFSLQVFCREDQNTALLLVFSSVVVDADILSQVLRGIANVTATEELPPTTAPVSIEPSPGSPEFPCAMEGNSTFFILSIVLCTMGVTLTITLTITINTTIICCRKCKKSKPPCSALSDSSETVPPPDAPSTIPPAAPPHAPPTNLFVDTRYSRQVSEEGVPTSLRAIVSTTGEVVLYDCHERLPQSSKLQSLRQRRVHPQQISSLTEEEMETSAPVTLPLDRSPCYRMPPRQATRGRPDSRVIMGSGMVPHYMVFNQLGGPLSEHVCPPRNPVWHQGEVAGFSSETSSHTAEFSTCIPADTITTGLPSQYFNPTVSRTFGFPAQDLMLAQDLATASSTTTDIPMQPAVPRPCTVGTQPESSGDPRPCSAGIPTPRVIPGSWTSGCPAPDSGFPTQNTPQPPGDNMLVYVPYNPQHLNTHSLIACHHPICKVPGHVVPSVTPASTSVRKSGVAEMVPPLPVFPVHTPASHCNVTAVQLEPDVETHM